MKILIAASNMVHINNFHRPYIDAVTLKCPECGEIFCFDESVFDDDEPLTCPNCGYVIDEIEIEDEDEE